MVSFLKAKPNATVLNLSYFEADTDDWKEVSLNQDGFKKIRSTMKVAQVSMFLQRVAQDLGVEFTSEKAQAQSR